MALRYTLASLAAVAMLASCAIPGLPGTPQPYKGLGYSLTYPGNWEQVRSSAALETLITITPRYTYDVALLSVRAISPSTDPKTLALQLVTGNMNATKLADEVRLGEQLAYQSEWQTEGGGLFGTEGAVVSRRDARAFAVFYAYPTKSSHAATIRADIDGVIASWKWVD